MNTCSKCKSTKPLSEFNIMVDGLNQRQSYCRKCQKLDRESDKNKYRNKDEVLLRSEWKLKIINRIGGRCVHCSLSPSDEWPIECFDFHHIDGSSDRNKQIGVLLQFKTKRDALVEEVDKCIVLCANCHRKHHAIHGKGGKMTAHQYRTITP